MSVALGGGAPRGTYHARRQTSREAASKPVARAARQAGAAAKAAFLVVAVAACTRLNGRLPVVSFNAATAGSKMLRPEAHASACAVRVLGLTVGPGVSPLDEALQALLALDPEADALTDVRIESRAVTTGLLDRSCVRVRANVVRTVPVVTLPAPAGHHHGAH